jgi:hypothetical protein
MIIIVVLKLDLGVDPCHELGSRDPGHELGSRDPGQRKSKKWLLQF